jgi:hypothetical protein
MPPRSSPCHTVLWRSLSPIYLPRVDIGFLLTPALLQVARDKGMKFVRVLFKGIGASRGVSSLVSSSSHPVHGPLFCSLFLKAFKRVG